LTCFIAYLNRPSKAARYTCTTPRSPVPPPPATPNLKAFAGFCLRRVNVRLAPNTDIREAVVEPPKLRFKKLAMAS
jgi:hypothetical protein